MSEDSHFDMSQDYENNSGSQQTIGVRVVQLTIQNAVEIFPDSGKPLWILDIACGPGVLTRQLSGLARSAFPNRGVHIIGLDYTRDNVEKMVADSGQVIEGVVGSFYDQLPENMDVVTSNEGLHWQPPYEMSGIIGALLKNPEKEEYREWAVTNFEKSIKNVYNSLNEGGLAVLQFGHEGQLGKLWGLIDKVLTETGHDELRQSINFPLFYPTLGDISKALSDAGFKPEDIHIEAFNQDLTEATPGEITGFLRAFTESAFTKLMNGEVLENFYKKVTSKLKTSDLDSFRTGIWHRTIVRAKK